jgi:hypothetical protein
LANFVDSTVGEYVDRPRAIEESIASVEPLADATRGQRVGEHQDDVAKVLKAVIGLVVDAARPPRSYGTIGHLGGGGDVALRHAEGTKPDDDLVRLHGSFESRGHGLLGPTRFRTDFRFYFRTIRRSRALGNPPRVRRPSDAACQPPVASHEMFVSDLRHFLALPDDVPGPATRMAERLTAIVRAATAGDAGDRVALHLMRRRRRNQRLGAVTL